MNPDYQNLVDTHAHLLSMEQKKLQVQNILQDLFDQGFSYVVDVGIDAQNWARRQAYAQEFPGVYLAEGVHPSASPWFPLDRLSEIRDRLQERKSVALGEIGLDYYRSPEHRDSQLKLFGAQLDLAKETKKPVILHNRNADEDLLALLQDRKLPEAGVFHCFSSTWATAQKGLDLGFYISFAGNLTYPGALDLVDTAQKAPLDRLLIETDAPYLSPQPVRGKTNHPGYLPHTLEFLSNLRNMSPGALAKVLKTNAEKLFGLGH